jgi:hypothetical protein
MSGLVIESHDDDSVTLTFGTLTATIRGASWKEANDAAHMLGALLVGRVEMRKLTSKARGMMDSMQRAEDALEGLTRHLDEMTDNLR